MKLQTNPLITPASLVAPARAAKEGSSLVLSPSLARSQERMAALLALVSGYVDAYAYLNYKSYASFMSGNTTQTGLQIGQAHFAQAATTLLPIPCFGLGVFAGTLLANSGLRPPLRWLFGGVSLLLAVDIAAIANGSLPGWGSVVLLSVAMGALNTTVTRVGEQPVSLGYVTGTLNNLAQHLALALKRVPVPNAQGSWDTHGRRVLLLLGVWAAFLGGALIAGAATPRFAVWTLLLPLLILTALALVCPATRTAA